MADDASTIIVRVFTILGGDRSDDVSAVQALAEEVGVEAVVNAQHEFDKGTCLHHASQWSSVMTARQLIAWGADVHSRNKYGFTPLFYAKSSEMVRVLVKEGGAKVNVISDSGHSPLSSTIAKPEVTEALLEEGALVKLGRLSPLVLSATHGRVEALKVLLTHRGFVRVIEWKGSSVHTARGAGVLEVVALLDEGLMVAKVWDRRLSMARVGLAAADARVEKGVKRRLVIHATDGM